MALQTEQAEQTQNKFVSFDNISLDKLLFNETYRLSRGSASQLVLGFKHMMTKLGEGANDYQRTLYPQLRIITQEIINSYETTFLTQTEPVYKQVFGANLNGTRNDGSLYRSINSNVNRNLTYGYVQFGQLVKVLTNRLKFIAQRDPQLIERYKSSKEEMEAYLQLQTFSNTFLNFLDEQNKKWTDFVNVARTTHNVQPSQFQLRVKKQPFRSNRTERPEGWTQVNHKS
jgi:hypothetical protein